VPAGEGLRVQARVFPLPGGPGHRPGRGGASLVLDQDGRRLLMRRDLAQEALALETLLAMLPALDPERAEDGEWLLPDTERCLDLLLQLEAVRDRVEVRWPEGQKLRAPRSVGPEALSLKAAAGQGWLDLEGKLQADPDRVLDLKALLALLEAHPGKYLPLGDGGFLALTQSLRRRLQDLGALGERRGGGLRLHPLAALGLEELGLPLEGDQGFRDQLARIRAAMALEPPVPAGLEAELRPYQEEGFRWLMRLAAAGFGACLADDMGLGKTVQALALLLVRGGQGPALVVAPTSVCANWALEAARFAPSLRLRPIAGPAGDRAALLEAAGPMDLVVASYTLLHREAERLGAIPWATVVLDEAQLIKNAFTKRSQSAMALQAGFRLVLSGTPLENHLGELWNLFRFLNPGLLGSLEQFRRRFQLPVERDRDPEALRRLRRLTAPFLLRRTKAQVLEELPPRIEVTLELEPSRAEAAFLEALRSRCLEQVERAGPAQPMLVLAAITRLRRACCAPELAQPGVGIRSSKLDAFLELVEEIRDNHHRALVFSQFVDHLTILRRHLDRLEIPYHYLDGATPPADRAAAVADFQRGEKDFFLISLRAGGTGLNLTGADVVIHMDPWWNPAVEDQASDRAHRIGQERPVTIYRLVLKGTLEAKIVSLHARKRDLADRLLEDTGGAVRLDAAELLRLLRG
jgi:SNF2 family DNA or RNA helicase